MALLDGCQEGKHTPKLVEVHCPKCGGDMEVFVKMGGAIGETGCTIQEEVCQCGYVIAGGTSITQLEVIL